MPSTVRPIDIIDLLIQEHDTIHSGLYLLDQAANILAADRLIPQEFQPWIIEFLRNFADKYHHAKEEDVLFPALVKKGSDSLSKDIAALVQDHSIYQGYIATLERLDLDSAEDRLEFAAVARHYVKNLRQHIFKENREIYAIAHQLLTSDELLELTSAANASESINALKNHGKRYTLSLRQWQGKFLMASSKPAQQVNHQPHSSHSAAA